MIVVAGSVHDNATGITLLNKVAAGSTGVTQGWVDAGFKNAVTAHGRTPGVDVEVGQRTPQTSGFAPDSKPKRRVARVIPAQPTGARGGVGRPWPGGRQAEFLVGVGAGVVMLGAGLLIKEVELRRA